MAHSYARRVSWILIVVEIILFILAAVSCYLSATLAWPWFWLLTCVAVVLFAVVRITEARPRLLEHLAFEDAAAQMARSAQAYGIERLYNMQLSSDQSARNVDTVTEINRADTMWLCANSGASYLDPGVYRHWAAVAERLRRDVPFKVVLLDPLSDEKSLRDLLNVGEDAVDSKINLPNLVRLYNEHPSLEIRFVSQGMHATVFATPSRMFYDPYHVGVVGQRIENRSFCIRVAPVVPPDGVGYYDLFRDHFNSLWRASKDFEQWVEANGKRFATPLPPLMSRRN